MKKEKTFPVPTEKSVNDLLEGLNKAVAKFEKRNQKVSKGMLMPIIFQLMLGYPYGWLTSSGRRELFVEAVTSEAKAYYAMMEEQAKKAQQEVIDRAVDEA